MTSADASELLILALDTTTEVRSVAVVRGRSVLASTRGGVLRENSARVLHDVDEALTAAGVQLGDIELFAAATGPGSFTGLRSGLATIKAFAATLNRPVAGVSTLHAVAYACGSQAAERVLACLPAGRGEVFAQLLSVEGASSVTELNEPVHVAPAALFEQAANWGGDLKWAGKGAHAHADALREFAAGKKIVWRVAGDDEKDRETNGKNSGEDASRDTSAVVPEAEHKAIWTLAAPSEVYATQVAALALQLYHAGRATDAEDLQALYVRLSDAELNERCRA
ncbi:MAG TPA: tRNA (adenosine(37)-N6)-threonylcarbamoyltransferase complex dimerization subunit type 1 TsaB [Pyrinomonadaceae bacterium]|nr:tRNA (adenosine(37)-N6)-threonylcarbamoyltransferase complex dimerization subunit type 1 TsaB [Pyrinomonadaceae bacterium]